MLLPIEWATEVGANVVKWPSFFIELRDPFASIRDKSCSDNGDHV